jgi:hypothetical protein
MICSLDELVKLAISCLSENAPLAAFASQRSSVTGLHLG